MIDLFGQPMTEADFYRVPKTMIHKKLGPFFYRRAEKGSPKRCSTCANCRAYGVGKRTYRKCVLLNGGRPSSPNTDVRANNVCDAWMAPGRIELAP